VTLERYAPMKSALDAEGAMAYSGVAFLPTTPPPSAHYTTLHRDNHACPSCSPSASHSTAEGTTPRQRGEAWLYNTILFTMAGREEGHI